MPGVQSSVTFGLASASYIEMQRKTPIRFAVAVLSCAVCVPCVLAAGQMVPGQRVKPSGALPATAPTAASASALQTSSTSSTVQTPAQRAARRAEVTYTQGQLAVAADNSSLNQILREIGRETGIKITGGVSDERVFGKYGPAAPAEILQTLLDGTGSNVLLIQSDSQVPSELILTPRRGGPTPPNPNAPGFDDDGPSGDDAPFSGFQPIGRPDQAQPANSLPIGFGGSGTPAPNQTAPNQAAPAAAAAPSATDPNDPQSPNGVKTPQQIYEQLQRLRQQQTPAPQ